MRIASHNTNNDENTPLFVVFETMCIESYDLGERVMRIAQATELKKISYMKRCTLRQRVKESKVRQNPLKKESNER